MSQIKRSLVETELGLQGRVYQVSKVQIFCLFCTFPAPITDYGEERAEIPSSPLVWRRRLECLSWPWHACQAAVPNQHQGEAKCQGRAAEF